MTLLSYKLTSFHQQEAYTGYIHPQSQIKSDKVKTKYYFTLFFLL
jgi:hypothetical protein